MKESERAPGWLLRLLTGALVGLAVAVFMQLAAQTSSTSAWARLAANEIGLRFDTPAVPGERGGTLMASGLPAVVDSLAGALGDRAWVYTVGGVLMGETLTSPSRAGEEVSFVLGVAGDYPAARGLALAEGRWFTAAEERAGAPVGLLGADARARLFGLKSALGRRLPFQGRLVRVIGVFAPSAARREALDPDAALVVPLRTWNSVVHVAARIDENGIKVAPRANRAAVAARAERWLVRTLPGRGRLETVNPEADAQLARSEGRRRVLAATALFELLAAGAMLRALAGLDARRASRQLGLRAALGVTGRGNAAWLLRRSVVPVGLGGLLAAGLWWALAAVPPTPAPDRGIGLAVLAPVSAIIGPLALAAASALIPAWSQSRLAPRALLAGASRLGSGATWPAALGALTVFSSLALGAGGAWSAFQGAIDRVQAQRSSTLVVGVGPADFDTREPGAMPGSGGRDAPLTVADLRALRGLPGVSAVVPQRPLPYGAAIDAAGRRLSPVAAVFSEPSALKAYGRVLLAGTGGGCLAGAALGLKPGAVLTMSGRGVSSRCVVSGVFAAPDRLERWLLLLEPQLIVPFGANMARAGVTQALVRIDPHFPAGFETVRQAASRLSNWRVTPLAPPVGAAVAAVQAEARWLGAVAAFGMLTALLACSLALLDLAALERERNTLWRALGATRVQVAGRYARLALFGGLAAGLAAAGLGLVLMGPLVEHLSAVVPESRGGEFQVSASLGSLALAAVGVTFLSGLAGLPAQAAAWATGSRPRGRP